MNDFLEQFLIEARELLAQATDDLSMLKAAPLDRPGLDRVFRAFHTLKGAAGIVEFDAMGRLMHHIEDALAQARNDGQGVSAVLIGRCVNGLDQLERWLEQISATEVLPSNADEDVNRLLPTENDRVQGGAKESEQAVVSPQTTPSWVADIFADEAARSEAAAAVRYRPKADCFFDNADPLALIADLPGLCALSIRPVATWPDIDELDPFHCNLIIYALSREPADRLTASLGKIAGEIEILTLVGAPETGLSRSANMVAQLISAQIKLLSSATADGMAGRIGSAGLVAGNIERYLGNTERAAFMGRLTADAVETGQTSALIREMRASLDLHERADMAAHDNPSGAQPRMEVTASLRVDVRRIDAAVKLAGELGVATNALEHLSRLAAGGVPTQSLAKSLKDLHAQFQALTDDLQRSVLAMRVLPLRQVFQRFPRLLREIAGKLGKEVQLVTEGDSTEADKMVVESLFDPLLHVLRNAVDHGIEPPAERIALGKKTVATIRLRGYRDGGMVIIEVIDDGRGIDAEAIRKTAVSRGLFPAETLRDMDREDVLQMIFRPGFSTATSVTELSGRGVGMDAVRVAIDRLGGSVGISTQPKAGTTIRFTLPFSVMMTRIMTVEANGQVFGLPFEAIVEMLHVPADAIAAMGAAQAIVWREQTVPLIDLRATLGWQGSDRPKPESRVAIVRVGGQLGAIIIDRFGEPMDLMLSSPEGLLAGLPGITGTTLLGDGQVLVVLDLEELLQ